MLKIEGYVIGLLSYLSATARKARLNSECRVTRVKTTLVELEF